MARFQQGGFFPYAVDEQGELVILFRTNKKGVSADIYEDFGGFINQFEPSIFFTAVRTFMTKSLGLFTVNATYEENEEPDFSQDQIYTGYQIGLQEILHYTKYLKVYHIGGEYLGIFYPLSTYTDSLEAINKSLSQSKGYSHIEFHWLKLSSIIEESTSLPLTPFVRSIIGESAGKLLEIQMLSLPQEEDEYDDSVSRPLPDYGVLLLESKDSNFYEAMILPNFLDENEQWEFYQAFKGEFPSKQDLQNLKGLIIMGSFESLEEPSFIKEFINNKQIKIVCFGHHFLTRMLGGETEKVEVEAPFLIGKAKVQVGNELFSKFGSVKDDEFYTLKFQSEKVSKVPPEAKVLCKSDHSEAEIYTYGDNILAIESHPEFTEKFLEKHIVIHLYETLVINEEYKNQILDQLKDKSTPCPRKELLEMSKRFLKS